MFGLHVVICVVAVLGEGLAKMELNPNTKELITFDGDELQIEVDNSGSVDGYLTLCVGSSVKSGSNKCPNGYADWEWVSNNHITTTITMNRQGKVFVGPAIIHTFKSILFKDDAALEVLLAKVTPSSVKVTLLNAQRYVPPEPVETTTEKLQTNSAKIGIAVGAVVSVVVFIIVVIGAVGLWLYCRKKNKQQIPPPEVVVHKTPSMVKSCGPSPKTDRKTETTPNKTSVRKSPLTPPTPQVPKPEPKPVSPAAVTTSPIIEKPPTPSVENAPTPSVENALSPSAESTPPPPESPTLKEGSLKVEKTQSETPPSPRSVPTPTFGKSTVENNIFKEKTMLPQSQMANVKENKFSYRKPDERFYFELMSENITCYGMRFGRLELADNIFIRSQCHCRVHKVWWREKDILKGIKSFSVDSANRLLSWCKKELAHGEFNPELGFNQPEDIWIHLDNPIVPASLFYYMMLMVKPELFKIERQSIYDKDVQLMPVSMLYCLILDKKLNRKFREELVIFMRRRALEIIQQAPRDSLREAAFPLNYLVLLYGKDPTTYLEGSISKSKH